jgi:hypothetical protein
MERLIKHYQSLQLALGDYSLPDLRPSTLLIKTEAIDKKALTDYLGQHAVKQGWITFTDRNHVIINQQTISIDDKILLKAEWVDANGSHCLTYKGRDQWQHSMIIESEAGESYLAEPVHHLSTEKQIDSLQYTKLYRISETGTTEAFLAYFTGFATRSVAS